MSTKTLLPPWEWSRSTLFIVSGSIFFTTYGLLAKKILPRCMWKQLSRWYFWPMLPITYIGRNLPWSPPYFVEVSPGVILGGVPLVFAGHVDELYRLGVRGVVNMQDEYVGPVQKYQELNVTQLYLPTVDHMEPSCEQMHTACTFIAEQTEAGHKVYVHCKGGHGRGAAIAFAWMLKTHRKSLKETQLLLSGQRKVRKKLHTQANLVAFHRQLVDAIE